MNNLAVNGAGIKPAGSGTAGRKFLVPVSLSERSHETVALAVALAAAAHGRIVLLHSVDLNIAGEERGIGRGQLLLELMIAADARLMELARTICREVPCSVVVTQGAPAAAILDAARTWGVDAIVMGAHLHRGFWWLRRNNLRAVLREAPRPVYVVAPREELNRIRPHEPATNSVGKETGGINTLAGKVILPFAIRQFPAVMATSY